MIVVSWWRCWSLKLKEYGVQIAVQYFGELEFFPLCYNYNNINPAHPNITLHILYNVFYTFLNLPTKKNCLKIRSVFSWWSYPLFSLP